MPLGWRWSAPEQESPGCGICNRAAGTGAASILQLPNTSASSPAGGLVAWLLGLGTLVAVAAGGRAVARRREP